MITELFMETADSYGKVNFDDIDEIALENYSEDPIIDSALIAIYMEDATAKMTYNVGLMEIEAVTETGSSIIYEGAGERIHAWFNAAIAWLKRFAGYIKGFFNKAFRMFTNLFTSGETWVKSNRKYITSSAGKAAFKEVKVRGYKYNTNLVYSSALVPWEKNKYDPNSSQDPKTYNNDFKENGDNYKRNVRLGFSGVECDSISDLRSKLAEKMRGGTKDKKEYRASELYSGVEELCELIGGGKKAKKAAKEKYEEAKKAIKKAIDEVKKEKNNITKDSDGADDKITACNNYLSLIKEGLNAQNAAHAVHMSALRGEQSQAKSVAGKIISKMKVITGPDNKGKSVWNESGLFDTDYDDYDTYDIYSESTDYVAHGSALDRLNNISFD